MENLPEIPTAEELAQLSDEELAELREELTTAFDEIESGEDTDEALVALAAIADGIDILKAEQVKREDAAAERAEEKAKLAARVRGAEEPEVTDEEPETPKVEVEVEVEVETPEPEPEEKPQAIAAAAKPRKPSQAAVAKGRPASQGPREAARPRMTITAGADVPGYAGGQELADLHQIADALIQRQRAFKSALPRGREDVVCASVHANFPEERQLSATDWLSNLEKVDAVTGPEAITAAGGICAPLTPYYDLMTLASSARPVRDALASYQATRGGVIVQTPPLWEDTSSAIGHITAAEDLAGGAGATKPCLTVTCPSPTSYEISAVSRCLQFGNFGARAYPELVQNWLTNVMAAHARVAERALLDGIVACSKQITAAATYGAARQLIGTLAKTHAYYTNVNRMDPNTRLRLLLPAYVLDLVTTDLAFGSGYDPAFIERGQAVFSAAISALGYNVSYYLDEATGRAQLMNGGARETDNSALGMFPDNVNAYVFAEGSFLFLDGGTLDFGIVRDSVLNPLNNFQIFAETFEGVACVGVESLELVIPTLADGTYAPTKTAITDF